MNLTSITPPPVATMSSIEIAELTGKEHRNVLRDIREILAEVHGEGGVLKFEHTHTNPQNKQRYTIFRLPKRETLILVSGYSVKMRAAIIDRWQELEAKNAATAFSLPDFNNPIAAARAWADAIKGKQAALEGERKAVLALEAAAPAVEFMERYVNAGEAQNFNATAKLLGWKPLDLIDTLIRRKIIFKKKSDGKTILPYQSYLDRGFFSVKTGERYGHCYMQTLVEPSGIEWLGVLLNGNLNFDFGGEK